MAEFTVPCAGAFEKHRVGGIEVLAEKFLADLAKSQARAVGNGDVPVVDQRAGQPGNEVTPPGNVGGVVLQRQEVLRRRGDVDAGEGSDGGGGHVERHGYAVFLGKITDLLGFQDAAGGGRVGVDDPDGAVLEQGAEVFLQVD